MIKSIDSFISCRVCSKLPVGHLSENNNGTINHFFLLKAQVIVQCYAEICTGFK
jgi:hypothetical protein